MRYMFNIALAKKYGLDEAVFLENLIFWVIRNRANGKNFFDGRTWTYNSVRAFKELFSFWSTQQLRRVLDSLLKQGVIVKGNYNKNPYDRTLWYALADEDTFIKEYGQIDLPKPTNGVAGASEPIPDIKPDIKPDILTSKPETAPACGVPFLEKEKEILQSETVQSVGVQSVGVQNSPVYKYKEEQSKEVVSKEELLTADKAAEPEQENKPKPKKLNKLQEFSNAVIDQFENLENKDQIAVWFKRNCRCLTDILRFCGGDIQTAVETIRVCVERLEKAGLTGGYEAVCRNLPEYYQAAKKRLNGGAYAK